MTSSLPSLESVILTSLEANQGGDVLSLDIRKATSIADYMIFCTGKSTRHSHGLKRHLTDDVQTHLPHLTKPNIQGEEDGQWIVLDFGDAIVHLMLEETRSYYALEKLWATLIAHHS